MYQKNNTKFTGNPFAKDCTFSEEEIDNLTKFFEKTITKFELDSNSQEFDLSKEYIINHACIWNDISYIGKRCSIVEKNDKIAVVYIESEEYLDLLKCIYRLEDLTVASLPRTIKKKKSTEKQQKQRLYDFLIKHNSDWIIKDCMNDYWLLFYQVIRLLNEEYYFEVSVNLDHIDMDRIEHWSYKIDIQVSFGDKKEDGKRPLIPLFSNPDVYKLYHWHLVKTLLQKGGYYSRWKCTFCAILKVLNFIKDEQSLLDLIRKNEEKREKDRQEKLNLNKLNKKM